MKMTRTRKRKIPPIFPPREYSNTSSTHLTASVVGHHQTNTYHDRLEYRPRLTDSPPKSPGLLSPTSGPSVYPWRQSPIPSYHPGLGYPSGTPKMALPSAPAPTTAPANGGTGNFPASIPRLLGRTRPITTSAGSRSQFSCWKAFTTQESKIPRTFTGSAELETKLNRLGELKVKFAGVAKALRPASAQLARQTS